MLDIITSRTIIAAVVSISATLLGLLGITVDDEAVTNGVVAIGSAGAAIWYRYKATKNLQVKGPMQ